MPMPLLSKLLIDQVYPARDLKLMQVVVAGMAAFALSSAFVGSVRNYFTQMVTAEASNALGLLLFNHLQHLPTKFFDSHRSGELMSRVGDARSSLGLLTKLIEDVVTIAFYLTLVPAVLVVLDWRLALVALLPLPLTVVVSTIFSPRLREYWKRSTEASADLSAIQVDTLTNITLFKSLAAEHHIFRKSRDQYGTIVRAQLRVSALSTFVGFINSILRAGGTALFTWYAWSQILSGAVSLGEFVAFSVYLGYLSGPVSQLTGLVSRFQQTAVVLGRTFQYLDCTAEQDPSAAYIPRASLIKPLKGAIQLDSVSFSYDRVVQTLSRLSLNIPDASVMAIVGPTGAGKSSILRLLCRIADPNEGTITIGGSRLQSIPLNDLRRQIAVVWQDVAVVRGTVWENLTLGASDINHGIVEEAVSVCLLEDLIKELPNGYNSVIGESGMTLSGGQRQRIGLARALIRRTPILLLDEATSQLDARTEAAILAEFWPRVCDRLVVAVTHRASTAAVADNVCMLERGTIRATGTHGHLVRSCEAYRKLMGVVDLNSSLDDADSRTRGASQPSMAYVMEAQQ
jgi:ABC-type bacteriocin/lantibiotic exporter with double-glycine peptidase domain